jgi:hypothetical protein
MTIEQIAERFSDGDKTALTDAIPGVRIDGFVVHHPLRVAAPIDGHCRREEQLDVPLIFKVVGKTPSGREIEGFGTSLSSALHSLHAATEFPVPLI